MGCICSKVKEGSEKISNAAKGAMGMNGSRVVGFHSPSYVFDAKTLIKGETEPGRGDQEFGTPDDLRYAHAGVIVGQKAFVTTSNGGFWEIDLQEKDKSKNNKKIGDGEKFKHMTALVHHDGKIYGFSDTIYKMDVGLGMLSGLPSLPGADKSQAGMAKTEAFSADDGNWNDSKFAIMIDGKCYVVCSGKLYQVNFGESDAAKNTKLVQEENWGSVSSGFYYDKKLYLVGSKVYTVQLEPEGTWPKAGWSTYDEQHSYWSTSAFVVDDHAFLGGYNGIYMMNLKSADGKREVKRWANFQPKVILNFI